MKKHTKGPWKVREKLTVGNKILITSCKDKYVSEIFTLECEKAIDKANAHLIAASPDLLEACKSAYKNLKGETEMGWSIKKRSILLDELLNTINKAEGGK